MAASASCVLRRRLLLARLRVERLAQRLAQQGEAQRSDDDARTREEGELGRDPEARDAFGKAIEMYKAIAAEAPEGS